MKGISIAIETIIFIILAVTVLSVLLLFLTGVGGPPQQRMQWESKRSSLCFSYTAFDRECNTVTGFAGLAELKDICGPTKLDVRECKTPTSDLACVRACCSFNCPL